MEPTLTDVVGIMIKSAWCGEYKSGLLPEWIDLSYKLQFERMWKLYFYSNNKIRVEVLNGDMSTDISSLIHMINYRADEYDEDFYISIMDKTKKETCINKRILAFFTLNVAFAYDNELYWQIFIWAINYITACSDLHIELEDIDI